MPSWVVPAVAAELWGVAVAHVLADVAAGRIPSRTEGTFVFVDIDPASAGAAGAAPAPVGQAPDVPAAETRPATYRRSLAWAQAAPQQPIVTPEERQALMEGAEAVIDDDDADDDDTPYGDAPAPGTLSDDDVPNWDEVRARVSRTRRPPGLREAA
jgi:hypothetical protein